MLQAIEPTYLGKKKTSNSAGQNRTLVLCARRTVLDSRFYSAMSKRRNENRCFFDQHGIMQATRISNYWKDSKVGTW